MREFLAAQILDIQVSHMSGAFESGVVICRELLQQAGIEPYEVVELLHVASGARWHTYALPGSMGYFIPYAADPAEIGVSDRFVVSAFRREAIYSGGRRVTCKMSPEIRGSVAELVEWLPASPYADPARAAWVRQGTRSGLAVP